jgi:hypothetical protein
MKFPYGHSLFFYRALQKLWENVGSPKFPFFITPVIKTAMAG